MLVSLFLICGSTYAKEILAGGLSPSSIENAINQASPGDTIVLPAGSYTGYYQTIDIPNGISLRGSGIDRTVLYHMPSNGPIFRWNIANSTSSYRVTVHDFKLVGVGDFSTLDKGIELLNHMKDFNIYNLHIEGFGDFGIMVSGDARGVINNCNFIDCYTDRVGYGIAVYGNRSWDDPKPPLGTKEAVFVEDCYFDGCKHAIASLNNSHYVFRHNKVEGLKHNKQGVDAHGKQDEHPSGSNTWEIYSNLIIGTGSPLITDWGVVVRGGSGVIWGNTINGCDPGNPCKAVAISIDEFTAYPDPYQVRDAYIWQNTVDGEALDHVFVSSETSGYIQKNREYFLYKKPEYIAYVYPHPLTLDIERICGDINGDLTISATDAQMAFDIYVGTIALPTLLQKENADVNCDGTVDEPNVTPADAQAIFYKFLGKYDLPCDCSKYARAGSVLPVSPLSSSAYVFLDGAAVQSGQVQVRICIESHLDLNSFGFDLEYPDGELAFVGIEEIDFNNDDLQIGLFPASKGVVRIGGFKKKAESLCFSGSICLTFQIKDRLSDLDVFSLSNPVDGVALSQRARDIRRTKSPDMIKRRQPLN